MPVTAIAPSSSWSWWFSHQSAQASMYRSRPTLSCRRGCVPSWYDLAVLHHDLFSRRTTTPTERARAIEHAPRQPLTTQSRDPLRSAQHTHVWTCTTHKTINGTTTP
ncbi:hypothetical protein PROFUN_07972 [Planoprotostelium fungivorum]|uniref:Uncharacterized protein n=1 Tax=Planoprotostelium fungivorum TaxID=1890364 RepID=A0A2P6MVD5_9EUKA|nr:hypothetical protein PROFUN_07972 [Planoprotostelium fungivorum]